MAESGKKVFFLDRDGVLNVDHGYVNEAEKFEWCAGVFEALKMLQEQGFALAIVTNQSGIGHGMYTEEDMQELHENMLDELGKRGIDIAAIAFCPHRRDGDCECRKPGRGMIDQIEAKIGPIDYEKSWEIGDKEPDIKLGKNIGVKTALVRSRYWTEDTLEVEPDLIVDSLLEASEKIND